MALKKPESMDELVYYTRRDIGKGEATAWVYREKCPKCGKGVVGKPKGEKGKIMIRAKKYVCPECSFEKEKKEYEEMLTASIEYTCPECKHTAYAEQPWKRPFSINCEKCKLKITVPKMKDAAKKEAKADNSKD